MATIADYLTAAAVYFILIATVYAVYRYYLAVKRNN